MFRHVPACSGMFHVPGFIDGRVKRRFVKGEALRILRTHSPKTTFEENISNFKKRLIDRGYPQTMIKNLLSDIKFTERESALLKHSNKEEKKYCLS